MFAELLRALVTLVLVEASCQSGEKFAVKRMPNRPDTEFFAQRTGMLCCMRWVREGPTEFNEQCPGAEVGVGSHVIPANMMTRYPTASERPWVDIGLVRLLQLLVHAEQTNRLRLDWSNICAAWQAFELHPIPICLRAHRCLS